MKKIKNIFMACFMSALIITMFYSNYTTQMKEMESIAVTKAAQVNEHIRLSKAFIEHMTMFSDDYLNHKDIHDSQLLGHLDYDSSEDSFNLDVLGSYKYFNVGNLTGNGKIPKEGKYRDEINLALEFNKYFSNFYNILPDLAWIYYTSEHNFMNMYPWVSSENFKFKEELKNVEFYRIALPENNPDRKILWTPVYADFAGKGLMVTLSSPVYFKDEFRGVLSIDLTTKRLSELIDSNYDTYIIDENDSVIATNTYVEYIKDVVKLNVIMDVPQNQIDSIKNLESGKVQKIGDYFIYSTKFSDAPLKMITIVPKWTIISRSLLLVTPIILICILLMLSLNEVDNRKKVEKMLTDSLRDLRLYHHKLEDAAKYDFLTNTYNRRGFIEIFNKNITIKKMRNEHIALIMCDIDYFKKINDTYGHAAGDKVLVKISNIMKNNVGVDDIVCRWGGEEFLIMLFDKSCAEAVEIAENIRKEVEQCVIIWEKTTEIKATLTLGVNVYHYADGFDKNILNVDVALYEGKRNGKNQVFVYQCQPLKNT